MKKVDDEYVIQARREGKQIKQIADELGLAVGTVARCCRKYGLQGKDTHSSGQFQMVDEEQISRRITEAAPNLEYISGYTSIDAKAYIKCKKCGTIKFMSLQFIKAGHSKPICKECQKEETRARHKRESEERKQKYKQEQAEKRKQRHQREVDTMLNSKGTQGVLSVCPKCNSLFIPRLKRQQFCSGLCGRRAHDALAKDRRLKKMRDVVIDKGISLGTLYHRDNGLCWLCGEPTNYQADPNSNDYPSIDHVIPLAKGGKHSWENVRLAHRICNSRKHDKIISAAESR